MALNQTHQPVNIAIIGGGFCGVLTAIHLMKQRNPGVHIHLINKGYPIARGVAYDPHTASLLLNVPNGRMSAFAGVPDHYTDWLRTNNLYGELDQNELFHGFSTREHYGCYLEQLWEAALAETAEDNLVTTYDNYADDLLSEGNSFTVILRDHSPLIVDVVVLATGNDLPHFPDVVNGVTKAGNGYFENPWKKNCIENLKTDKDILIIGNGLTMADTVMALAENGFEQTVHTVSPNGYRLKPWKEAKIPYINQDISAMASVGATLLDLLKNFNKHRKIAVAADQSIYPVIDSIRPHAQKLWQSFGINEKKQFLKYLNSFWGSARHRLPVKSEQVITELQRKKRIVSHRGYVVSLVQLQNGVEVILNCGGELIQLNVQRVINCTGPEPHLMRRANTLLNNLAKKGLICAGPCNIGIYTRPDDGSVISRNNIHQPNLFVIGGNLKGMLWESTAIPELSLQAKKLAEQILSTLCSASSETVES